MPGVVDNLKLKDAVQIDTKGFKLLNFKVYSRFEEILVYLERILSKEKYSCSPLISKQMNLRQQTAAIFFKV